MPGAITDKFRIASGSTRPVVTTLALPKAVAATTAEIQVATGWNTTTAVDYVMYRRQLNTTTNKYEEIAGTRIEGKAVLTGTTLSAMTIEGTEPASGYAADGNTVVFCGATAQWADDLVGGILEFANQDATLKTTAVRTALGLGSASTAGWEPFAQTFTVATGYNKGNKEFDLTPSADVTSFISPGMRLKLTRGTTPPTQCADLEASSSQYASRASGSVAGITFTDDFTCEAWVKLESYGNTTIVSRYDGANGWIFNLNSSGQVEIFGDGADNQLLRSYQSVPLNQWVHVAGALDMSAMANSAIYINGVLVPSLDASGAGTTLTQAGNLQVGAYNAGQFFDGKISDVRVWSTIRTATQIRDNMNQLISAQAGLVFNSRLAGDFTDNSGNGNTLTASGGAVATDTDNPMKATEYAIITKVTASTVTVFCPEGHSIPNMTLSAPSYSTQKIPYGFPGDRGKWTVIAQFNADALQNSPVTGTYYDIGMKISVPLGEWVLGYEANVFVQNTTLQPNVFVELSTSASASTDKRFGYRISFGGTNSNITHAVTRRNPVTETAQTLHYLLVAADTASHNSIGFRNATDRAFGVIYAECAHL